VSSLFRLPPSLTRVIACGAIAVASLTPVLSATAANASTTKQLPICENAQLKLTETTVTSISQYDAEKFRVTNIGKSACTLDGFPQVEFDVQSPKNTYHAANAVRTPAGPSEYFKTEKARLVIIQVGGAASFGLSFTTAFVSSNDDALGCEALNQILALPIAPLGNTSPPVSAVDFDVSIRFNICRADRTVYVTPVELGPTPRVRASSSPKDTTTLFAVTRTLSFGTYGPDPSIVAINGRSIYLTGTFDRAKSSSVADLIRVDRQTFTVTASTRLPNVTSIAYGDNALWWATGAPGPPNASNSPTPPQGRMLLKVNPTSLKVLARFRLPGPTLLVTVAQGNVWVATSTQLIRLNPNTGAIIAKVALGLLPVALAPSYNSGWLYVLGYLPGDHLKLADYSAGSGRALDSRQYPNFSIGPLAVVPGGVWIPVQSTRTQSATERLFKGQRFTSGPSLGNFTFDTEGYVEGHILWLIDTGGQGPTVCANPVNGTIRAEGSPVGVEYGAMAFDGGRTYLLRSIGTNDSLLQIDPSSKCSL
jgi:hypothetical protein